MNVSLPPRNRFEGVEPSEVNHRPKIETQTASPTGYNRLVSSLEIDTGEMVSIGFGPKNCDSDGKYHHDRSRVLPPAEDALGLPEVPSLD